MPGPSRAEMLEEAAKRGILPAALKPEYEKLRASGAMSKSASTAGNQNFDNLTAMRKEFTGRKEVQDFQTVLPQLASAMRSPPGGAGDLNVIYAFGKVMDPGSVVREGEMTMAGDTASLPQRLQQYATKIQTGGKLDPEVRRGLIDAMRTRAQELANAYNQTRFRYRSLASKSGFDPEDVIGPHIAAPFQQAEANYLHRPVRNLDGSEGARPVGATAPALSGYRIVGRRPK
jgi:hypothetical protein